MLPAVIFFAVFIAYPVIFNIYIGFTEWSGLGEPVWKGLANYKKVLTDPAFGTVLKNFVFITGAFVILDCALGMVIAAVIKMGLKISGLAKVLIYLPLVLSPVIIGYTFRLLLEANNGIVNVLLRQGVGFAMILYIAGISGIPSSVYEAARIDGAGEVAQFFYITVPLLRGTTYTLVIMNVITYIKLFDLVQVMTGGGPGNTTVTFTIYVYNKAFKLYDMGGASAVATIMLLISLILTAVQLKMYDRGRI